MSPTRQPARQRTRPSTDTRTRRARRTGARRGPVGLTPAERTRRPSTPRPCTRSTATPPTTAAPTRRRITRKRLMVIAELATLTVVVTASSAHAETVHVLAAATSVDQVLTNVRNWLMGILASVATVFLTLGGVRYVMGGGEPGEIEKAKVAFKAAGIGYALAALAPLVVTVLQGIVGS